MAAEEGFFDDLENVVGLDLGVPDGVGVDDDGGSEAARGTDADLRPEFTGFDFLLEAGDDVATAGRAAGGFGVAGGGENSCRRRRGVRVWASGGPCPVWRVVGESFVGPEVDRCGTGNRTGRHFSKAGGECQ